MENPNLIPNTKYNIYVCLARSFDSNVIIDNKSNGTQLICSTYCTDNDLLPYSLLDGYIGNHLNPKKNFILKISNSEEQLQEIIYSINKEEDYNKIYEGEYLDVYNVNN